MIIPDTDVNLATEVRDVLSTAGGIVTNNTVTFFSVDANLNMWSKYKPVVHPQLFFSLDEWKGINGWEDKPGYRGFDGTCGLTIKTYQTMASMQPSLEDGTALWTYVPPKGGSTEPMRLGDFRGYNPDAFNPIGDITTSGISQNGDYNIEGNVTFSVEVSTGMPNNLEYSDIYINDTTPLTDFYLGIYASKGSTWRYVTSDTTIGDTLNFTTTIPLTTGDWKVMPFLCSSPQLGQEQEGTYVSANIPAKTFTIISSNDVIHIILTGMWNASGTIVESIFMEIINNSNSDITIDKINVQLRGQYDNSDQNVGKVANNYYKGSQTASLTIPANTSIVTEIGDFANIELGITESENHYLLVTAYQQDTVYRHEGQIEEYMPEG